MPGPNPKRDPRRSRLIADELLGLAALVRRQPKLRTDLEAMLADRSEAYRLTDPTEDSPDFQEEALAELIQRLRESAPRVSITPPSADEDVLGRVASFKFHPTEAEIRNNVKQQDTLVFRQGKPNETQAVCLDVGVVTFPDPDPAGLISCRPYCDVDYGADGFTNQVRIDVGLGQRVNVPGNYVSVKGGMEPPAPGRESGIMTIGASLGFFAATSLAPVTRTLYADDIAGVAAAGVATFIRPKKGQTLFLYSTLPLQPITVRFFDTGSLLVYEEDLPQANQFPSGIVLTNDVFRITVTNGAAGLATFRAAFGLSL